MINDLTVSGTSHITFGIDDDGNYGYKKVGADTVTPFKSGEYGSEYLRYNEDEGYIQALDDEGDWINIYKTNSVPIISFNGVYYNLGTYSKHFNSDMVSSSNSYPTIDTTSYNYIGSYSKCTDGQSKSYFISFGPFDVQNYTTLKLTMSGSQSSGSCYCGLGLTKYTVAIGKTGSISGTKSYDVSDYSFVYFTYYITHYSSVGSHIAEYRCSKIWAE